MKLSIIYMLTVLINESLCRMDKKVVRYICRLITLIPFIVICVFHYRKSAYLTVLPPLMDHRSPMNYPSMHKNVVLLSCSSDSYTFAYCYYLPYVALAWRRIGFEPVIYLVGSERKFHTMPLFSFLQTDLRMECHFVDVDPARSISVSQIIRLFGGFMAYNSDTTDNLFIIIGDVDLLPVSRRRFEIYTNDTNYILSVNAYCCDNDRFSYDDFHNIHYYPMSYMGMTKDLWQKIFLPLKSCSLSANITVGMLDCCLREKMNVTVPENVQKPSKQWDIDQQLLSLLLARAIRSYGTHIDKRNLGYRLDPNERFLASEFNSILSYDDVHLPNKNDDILFNDRSWLVLKDAFSLLFNDETMRLLSRYHHLTTAIVLESRHG